MKVPACMVRPRARVRLCDYDPGRTGGIKDKKAAHRRFRQVRRKLSALQDILYADDRYSLLIILQALDAAGKDSLIKHVMTGVNPQGCQVYSFKVPSSEELDHDFLWRYARALPRRGHIGIFNRSYYEEVLVVRVHPPLLEAQRLPAEHRGRTLWEGRYDDMNAFERHLVRNGTMVLKFFLHVSKKEQKKRFLARIDTPEKNWKFSAADLHERRFWDDYRRAYEEMLRATSTIWAPWYIVPADHKWYTRLAVAQIITARLAALPLRYPAMSPEAAKALRRARRQLVTERT